MKSYQAITQCRICKNSDLISVLDLGSQVLTGRFPKHAGEKIDSLPLELVKCDQSKSSAACGLLQLKHTGDLSEFYGAHYGYRSSLNQSMVAHLREKIGKIQETVSLSSGDLIIDIGSNDSTTLQSYPTDRGYKLLGIDPTGKYFKEYYPAHIDLIPEFFSAAALKAKMGVQKAKIITSFSMFYDLPDPVQFVDEIRGSLADDGVWVFEQSYMPTMLEMNSYDTVCHEHLEYYGLKQIEWIFKKVGMKILDVEFNTVNGGSFSVTAAKSESTRPAEQSKIQNILKRETDLGLDTLKPYEEFRQRVAHLRTVLKEFLVRAKQEGRTVAGYGASTKGNVTLQYCGLTAQDLSCIAEVNASKFGSFTPGSLIPIVSEADAKLSRPDYFLVLPWHFRDSILKRETEYIKSGGRFVFPFPNLETV